MLSQPSPKLGRDTVSSTTPRLLTNPPYRFSTHDNRSTSNSSPEHEYVVRMKNLAYEDLISTLLHEMRMIISPLVQLHPSWSYPSKANTLSMQDLRNHSLCVRESEPRKVQRATMYYCCLQLPGRMPMAALLLPPHTFLASRRCSMLSINGLFFSYLIPALISALRILQLEPLHLIPNKVTSASSSAADTGKRDHSTTLQRSERDYPPQKL